MPEADNQCIFLATQAQDGVPLIALGLTEQAWEHMKNGDSHSFDFTKMAIPLRLLVFGGKDKQAIMETLITQAEAWGIKIVDARDQDFSINHTKPH